MTDPVVDRIVEQRYETVVSMVLVAKGKGREMERFAVKRSKRGATVVFIVVDTLKGTIAKTAITDKARAERIARRLNERVEEPCSES
jgi:hypothetical protein